MRSPLSTAGATTTLQTHQPDPGIVCQGIKTARPAPVSDLGTETRLSPARTWAIKRFAAQQPGQFRCLPMRRRQSLKGQGAGSGLLLPACAHRVGPSPGTHRPAPPEMWAGHLAKATRVAQSLQLLIPATPCKLLGGKTRGHGGWTQYPHGGTLPPRGLARLDAGLSGTWPEAQMGWDRRALIR